MSNVQAVDEFYVSSAPVPSHFVESWAKHHGFDLVRLRLGYYVVSGVNMVRRSTLCLACPFATKRDADYAVHVLKQKGITPRQLLNMEEAEEAVLIREILGGLQW